MPAQSLGFDIYGTLVNVHAMSERLRPFVHEKAPRFAELWREKQIEYSFRRAAMHLYAEFSVCTEHALDYTAATLRTPLSADEKKELIQDYQHLPPFPDALPGLRALKAEGHRLVAFSNGAESKTRPLLKSVGLFEQFEDVVSVDDCQTFKPAPAVYHHLYKRLGERAGETWVISSNPFDVIGAKAAGLRAAWVQRGADKIYDPWGIEPDLTVASLVELAERMKDEG